MHQTLQKHRHDLYYYVQLPNITDINITASVISVVVFQFQFQLQT